MANKTEDNSPLVLEDLALETSILLPRDEEEWEDDQNDLDLQLFMKDQPDAARSGDLLGHCRGPTISRSRHHEGARRQRPNTRAE